MYKEGGVTNELRTFPLNFQVICLSPSSLPACIVMYS